MIRHPNLKASVKHTMEANLEYAKGGAIGPDLGNFSLGWNSANAAHYCCSGDLARQMLQLATTPQDEAFAYGWMVHVAADSVGHPWVNSRVCQRLGRALDSCTYTPEDKDVSSTHRSVEGVADCLNQRRYGKMIFDDPNSGTSRYHYDISFNVSSIFHEAYGRQYCGINRINLNPDGSTLARLVWSSYSAWWADRSCGDDREPEGYRQAFKESVERSVDALNFKGESLQNRDLDDGEIIQSSTGRCEDYSKCRERAKLKPCGHVERFRPGGDHPDDNESVVRFGGKGATESWAELYRLGAKKGKSWVL